MERRDVIAVVKDLIDTVENSKEAFRLGAKATDNADVKMLFLHYFHQREQFAIELQHLASALRGEASEPESKESEAGYHEGNSFPSFSSATDQAAIVAECEHWEDHSVRKYCQAVDLPLPDIVQHAVQTQGLEIKAAHDKLKSLRNLTRAA